MAVASPRGRRDYELYGVYEQVCGLLKHAGFKVYRLSQARASKQTAGLPDLLIMHPGHKVEATVEVKASWGKVSPAQQEFSDLRTACGRVHLVGGLDVVQRWLVSQGLATDAGGRFVLTPHRRAG